MSNSQRNDLTGSALAARLPVVRPAIPKAMIMRSLGTAFSGAVNWTVFLKKHVGKEEIICISGIAQGREK